MMRVVLDTNVLLAALISPYSPPDTIYRAWRDRRFELVTSSEQLDELRRVSRYPKLKRILPPHRVGAMVNNMQRAVVLERLPDLPEGVALSDPDDAFVLATAIAGDASWLVTGDRKAGLLQLGHMGQATITTPREFVRQLSAAQHPTKPQRLTATLNSCQPLDGIRILCNQADQDGCLGVWSGAALLPVFQGARVDA